MNLYVYNMDRCQGVKIWFNLKLSEVSLKSKFRKRMNPLRQILKAVRGLYESFTYAKWNVCMNMNYEFSAKPKGF